MFKTKVFDICYESIEDKAIYFIGRYTDESEAKYKCDKLNKTKKLCDYAIPRETPVEWTSDRYKVFHRMNTMPNGTPQGGAIFSFHVISNGFMSALEFPTKEAAVAYCKILNEREGTEKHEACDYGSYSSYLKRLY